jgi:hypothetical protein
MSFPVFASGDVLNASDMNAVSGWLVKTQTVGTGVSSVSVTGAFSADYDNYRIIYDGGTSTINGSLSLQLAGAATGYYFAVVYNQYTVATALGIGQANVSSYVEAGRMSTQRNSMNIEVFNPFLAAQTGFRSASTDYFTSGFVVTGGGMLNNTTSYTGFTVLTTGGATLTGGTIRVYGYRN